MDPVYLIWLYATGALIGGGIVGAIVYRNLAPGKKETDDLRAELDEARREMETYKSSVNNHFDKTAALVNELTQDYVKVYKHLAEGAQSLGDSREFLNVLEQHQGKVLISVDAAATPQDTIVSEQSADTAQRQEAPADPVAHHDEEKIAAAVSANGEDADTQASTAESAAAAAEQDETSGSVTELGKPAPDQDDSDAMAAGVVDSSLDSTATNKSAETEDKKKVAEPA